jgi:Tfp pilus assembly protein FimT
LLELVIVLSVIGLLAGLSWPMLMRPWSKSRVQQAAQDLCRELLRTRLTAIERGQAFQLRWRPGSGEFMIRPWQPPAREVILLGDESNLDRGLSNQQSSNQTETVSPDSAETTTDPLSRDDVPSAATTLQLIDGIVFLDPEQPTALLPQNEPMPSATPSQADELLAPNQNASRDPLDDRASSSLESETGWSSPVWFYPDGRTTNARWTLIAEDGYQIEVILRGWVGSVRVGPVQERSVPDAELDDIGPERPIDDPARTAREP